MATVHALVVCVVLLLSPVVVFSQESRHADILPKCLGKLGLRVGNVPSLSRLLLKQTGELDVFDPKCWSTLDRVDRGHISRIMGILCGPNHLHGRSEAIKWSFIELCCEFNGELLVFDRADVSAGHSIIVRAECDPVGAHKRFTTLAKLLYPSSDIESRQIGSVNYCRVFSALNETGQVAGNGLVWWFQESTLLVSNFENSVEWYLSLIKENSIPSWREQISSLNRAASLSQDSRKVDVLLWGEASVQSGRYFGFERFNESGLSSWDSESRYGDAVTLAAIGFNEDDCTTSTRVLISSIPKYDISSGDSIRIQSRVLDANEVTPIASLIPLDFRRITAIRGKLSSLWYSNVSEKVVADHQKSLGLFDRFLAMLSRDTLTQFDLRSNGMLWIIELPAAPDDENQGARVVFALDQTTESELFFKRFCDEINQLPGEGDLNETIGRRIDLGSGRRRVLIYDSRSDDVMSKKILAFAKESEASPDVDGILNEGPSHLFVVQREGVIFIAESRAEFAAIGIFPTISSSAALTEIVSRATVRPGRLELTMPAATDSSLLRHRYQSSNSKIADEWLMVRFPPQLCWSVPMADGVSVIEAVTPQIRSQFPELRSRESQNSPE